MAKEKDPTAEDEARGARLAALRDSRGWSQADLAAKAGFKDPTGSGRQRVSRLESGFLKFTSPEQQSGFARAYGLPMGAIVEYARGELTLDELLGAESGTRHEAYSGRAERERWRRYAKTHPAFGAQATMALAAGVVTDDELDAASDELTAAHGAESPSAADARAAIIAARDGVSAWREMSSQPGTTLQDVHGSKGKPTRT